MRNCPGVAPAIRLKWKQSWLWSENRTLVPVLDLAQGRLDILGHRPFPIAGVLKDRKMP
jgi:hypothetical protein